MNNLYLVSFYSDALDGIDFQEFTTLEQVKEFIRVRLDSHDPDDFEIIKNPEFIDPVALMNE